MNEKKKFFRQDNFEPEYICPSASWGDMTGLIPANPDDKQTRESYEEIYPYLPTDRA